MTSKLLEPLRLQPEYRPYVWGGTRLRPGEERTAEAWVVYEQDRILDGPLAGLSLGEAAARYGSALLGRRVTAKTGLRFPVLIKLLDCAAWLSLQVHPNDEQAQRLEGEGQFGKTEAWHVLQAGPEAEILCGLRPGVGQSEFEHAVRHGGLLDLVHHLKIMNGDTIYLPPGMLHALGPGLLIYEVQQTSDLTYRVYDWDRPASQGRSLHIEQSLAVANPHLTGQAHNLTPLEDGSVHQLVTCPYFTLQLLAAKTHSILLETQGETFHALTVTEGGVQVEGSGWSLQMGQYETIVIPADTGAYRLHPLGDCRILQSFVG
jgi:mannose-6-phosphate isomerase